MNSSAEIKNFTDLKVWQLAREIRIKIYSLLKRFPDYEKYALESQMRRAAISVTANIAEGYGRFHYQENIQFCRQARGSLYELQDHLTTCQDQKYITENEAVGLIAQIYDNIRLLDGYIRYLNNEKQKSTR